MTIKSHAGAAATKNGSGLTSPDRADGTHGASLPPANDNSQVRGFKPFLPTHPHVER